MVKNFYKYTLFAIFLSNLVKVTFEYSFNGYQIHDLQGLTIPALTTDAEQWSVVNPMSVANPPYITLCDRKPILGGQQILDMGGYLERKYEDLPSHNLILVQLEFYIIDDWRNEKGVEMYVDNRKVGLWQDLGSSDMNYENICGEPGLNDLGKLVLLGQIKHTGRSMTLKIEQSFQDAAITRSFGIRDLVLSFKQVDEPENSICGFTYTTPLFQMGCPCTEEQYLDEEDLTCDECHKSCGKCFGPTSSDCYTCAEGNFYYKGACYPECQGNTVSGPDGECIEECDSHHVVKKVDGQRVCQFKCSGDEFLNWDLKCQDDCSLKIEKHGAGKLCSKWCKDNQFTYWDHSCLDTCEQPLSVEQVDGLNYCQFPCEEDEYLYNNGTCSNSCSEDHEVVEFKGKKLCNAQCSLYKYRYWDGTCEDQCLPPLTSFVNKNEQNNCEFGCSNKQFYLYQDGSCYSQCSDPMLVKEVKGMKLCIPPCLYSYDEGEDYYYPDQGVCKSYCDEPNIMNETQNIKICIESFSFLDNESREELAEQAQFQQTFYGSVLGLFVGVNALFKPEDMMPIYFVLLASLFDQLRFINLQYSGEAIYFFKSMEASDTISLNLPFGIAGFQNQNLTRSLPTTFKEYSYGQYIEEEQSNAIITIAFFFAIGGLLSKLQRKNWQFLKMLKTTFWHNFTLLIILANQRIFIQNQILVLMGNGGGTLLSLMFLGLYLFGIAKILGLSFTTQKKANEVSKEISNKRPAEYIDILEDFEKSANKISILFAELRIKDIKKPNLFLFFCIRTMLSFVVIAVVHNVPGLQIAILLFLSISSFIIVAKNMPFLGFINNICYLIVEFLFVLTSIQLARLALSPSSSGSVSSFIIIARDIYFAIILLSLSLSGFFSLKNSVKYVKELYGVFSIKNLTAYILARRPILDVFFTKNEQKIFLSSDQLIQTSTQVGQSNEGPITTNNQFLSPVNADAAKKFPGASPLQHESSSNQSSSMGVSKQFPNSARGMLEISSKKKSIPKGVTPQFAEDQESSRDNAERNAYQLSRKQKTSSDDEVDKSLPKIKFDENGHEEINDQSQNDNATLNLNGSGSGDYDEGQSLSKSQIHIEGMIEGEMDGK